MRMTIPDAGSARRNIELRSRRMGQRLGNGPVVDTWRKEPAKGCGLRLSNSGKRPDGHKDG